MNATVHDYVWSKHKYRKQAHAAKRWQEEAAESGSRWLIVEDPQDEAYPFKLVRRIVRPDYWETR